MPIPVSCSCGKSFAAPDNLSGKRVKCPGCQQPLKIKATFKTKSLAAAGVAVRCACGKSFRAPANLAGKKVRCPACQQPIQVPDDNPAANGLASLLDEVGFQQAAAEHRCPNCKEDLLSEAILCVKCGYNLETGKQIRTKVSKREKSNSSSVAPGGLGGNGKGIDLPAIAARKKGITLVAILYLVAIVVGAYCSWQASSATNVQDLIENLGPVYKVAQLCSFLAWVLSPIVIYRLASKFESSSSAIIYTVLAVIPCLNLIILFFVNTKAAAHLKAGGYRG